MQFAAKDAISGMMMGKERKDGRQPAKGDTVSKSIVG
jgi:hypothetical protein